MYAITLRAHYFMGIWRVEGQVRQDNNVGGSDLLASFQRDFVLAAEYEDDDDLINTLRAIREWADVTILNPPE